MLKTFLTLFLFCITSSPSFSIELDDGEVSIEDFKMEYLLDDTHAFTIESVRDKVFSPINNRSSPGLGYETVWHRLAIKNRSTEPKKIYLHSDLSFLLESTIFYEIKNNRVVNKHRFNTKNKEEIIEKMTGASAIIPISLKAGERTLIYIKTDNFNSIRVFSFALYDKKSSNRTLQNHATIVALIAGMLLALTLYHLVFLIIVRRKEYLYYVLYLASSSLAIFQVSGVLANTIGFYYYGNNAYYLLAMALMSFFHLLFIKAIFDDKALYPKEHLFLNILIGGFFILFIIGIVDISLLIDLSARFYSLFLLSVMMIIFSFIKKQAPNSKVLLLGTLVYVSFGIISDQFYAGRLPYSFFNFTSGNIGILVEAMALAVILSYRMKKLQTDSILLKSSIKEKSLIKAHNSALQKDISSKVNDLIKKDELIRHQNKQAAMGQILENIAHQWRQPLSQINSSILLMDEFLGENEKRDKALLNHMNDIENQTLYMSKTIDDFRQFYQTGNLNNNLPLTDTIESALSIVQAIFKTKNISINKDYQSSATYYGNSDEIKQTLIIILNNSLDVFIARDVTSPRINISLNETTTQYIITLCDNGGGIKDDNIDNIDNVFTKYYSTKNTSDKGGLGLYISKSILEQSGIGTLKVENNASGACFSILLHKKNIT